MSTIKSSSEHLTLNADGAGKDLKLQTNGTERAIVKADGKVGIGTSNPNQKFIVNDSTTDFISIFTNSTSSGNGLKIQAGDNSGDRILQLNDKDGNEKLRVLATGGITFNGDTASANALDDYEEGTWTPSLNGSSSGSKTGTGRYTKIGRTVHVIFNITNVTNQCTGNLSISGFPFTMDITELVYVPVTPFDIDTSWTHNVYLYSVSGSSMDLYEQKDGVGSVQLSNAHMSGTYFRIEFTYTV